MEQTYMSLSDFYKTCLEKAKKQNYYWVISLIARSSDAELVFDKIERDWASLNDLTGKKILFVFSAEGIRKKSLFFAYDKPWRGQICPFGTIANNDKLIGDKLTYEKRYTISWKEEIDWKKIHSQSISEISKDFGIIESEIPCLLFINMKSGNKTVIHINNKTDIYTLIKKFIGEINEKCEQLDNLQSQMNTYIRIDKYFALRARLEKEANKSGEESKAIHEVLNDKKSYLEVKDSIKSRKLRDEIKKLHQWKKQYINCCISNGDVVRYEELKNKIQNINNELNLLLNNIEPDSFIIDKDDLIADKKESGSIIMKQYVNNGGRQIIVENQGTYNENQILDFSNIVKEVVQSENMLNSKNEIDISIKQELETIKKEIKTNNTSPKRIQEWINNLSSYVTIGSAVCSPGVGDFIMKIINMLKEML